jgi:hypothetical protein
MSKLKSPKLWMYVGIGFLFLCGFTLLLVAKLPTSKNNGNGNSSTSTTSSAQSSTTSSAALQDPAIAQKYDLVGVKGDDTVAVISSSDNTEIVINLEHKQWKDPKWSPDGKYISVLAKSTLDSSSSATSSGQSADVYDLFIYSLVDNKWMQTTAYTQLEHGITGYSWQDGSIIAFTQGVTPDNWMHNYNVTSNEISKLFKVEGSFSAYEDKPVRYITRDSVDATLGQVYRVYSNTGQIEFTFVGRAVQANSKITNLIPGSDNAEFAIFLDSPKVYFWSFNKPEFNAPTLGFTGTDANVPMNPATLNLICAQNSGYFAWTLSNDSKKFFLVKVTSDGAFSLVQSLSTTNPLQVDSASSNCIAGKVLAKTFIANGSNQSDRKWYLLSDKEIKEIVAARSYPELRIRAN